MQPLRLAPLAVAAAFAGFLLGTPQARAAAVPPFQEYSSVTTLPDPADTRSPLDILSASFGQLGQDAFLSLRTRRAWHPLGLTSHRSLCVNLFPLRVRRPANGRVCVGHAPGSDVPLLRYWRLPSPGSPSPPPIVLSAQVLRRDDHSIEARFPLAQASLTPGLRRWQARSVWSSATHCRRTTKRPHGCVDVAPNAAPARIRVVHVRLAGCERAPPTLPQPITTGPTTAKTVALTFDDGPAVATPSVLQILERQHVPATFFMVGDQIGARAALVQRMLRDGDMVGNHSWDHANLEKDGPAAEQELKQTDAAVALASGFVPCLFRAPYGAWSPALLDQAKALGLASVDWTVDPRDWSRPGTKVIERRVLRAVRPGSIVLMHDGGGDRSETVAALPAIIAGLRARGYTFDTVTGLVGLRSIFVH